MNSDLSSNPPVPNSPTFKIKVLGIGGAGGNIAGQIAGNGLAGVEFCALNTDAQALAQVKAIGQFHLGRKLTGGLGAGGEPERGREAGREDFTYLVEMCRGMDLIFVVAGMGGGTGTGASPIIAEAAREAGALVIACVTLPFDCEGRKRQKQAFAGLQLLMKAADGVICLPNQKVFQLIDENTSLTDTFKITNDYLGQGIASIAGLINRAGLINIDFADLASVVRGTDSVSTFASVTAAGPQRARDLIEGLAKHPWLDAGQTLQEADSVLVSLVGGSDLAMAEINRVMEQVSRQCENADVKMGAAVDSSFGDRLEMSLVVSSPRLAPASAETADAEKAPVRETVAGSGELLNQALQSPSQPRLPKGVVEDSFSGGGPAWRSRRKSRRAAHPQLPLQMNPKGRFDKSEPTLYKGEDLDVPTFVRRGLILN